MATCKRHKKAKYESEAKKRSLFRKFLKLWLFTVIGFVGILIVALITLRILYPPEKLKNNLEQVSRDIWQALEIRDFGRIDFRMNKEGQLFFLEVNPLPGMDFDTNENDLSFYPYMAMNTNYTYDMLVRRILESACSRYGLKL